ncbi:MAG: sensor histidine kinase, partial [Limisphaerales bacterium]
MNEIDELKKRVEQLEQQLKDSSDQSRMYLQNVAHQLTAPLGAIKWSIEALKDETIPIHRKGNLLRSIYSQGSILVHLIKNFSLMSNLETDNELGQMRNQDVVDVMLLAINLANDFQPQAFDVEKKISVDDGSFKKVLSGRKVKVEKNLVAQAISNLLENAVKYGDPKTTILVKAEKLDGVGISVTSTGLPILGADIEKLSERGFRGNAARQRVAAGTGIGLYLAKRVMHLHNGKLVIDAKDRIAKFTLV